MNTVARSTLIVTYILLAFASTRADTATVGAHGGSFTVTVPETGKTYSFAFNNPRGLLGPSSDPSSQKPFVNAEQTVFALTCQPETKSGYVHIFYKDAHSQIIEITNVHQKIRGLFAEKPDVIDKNFLRVESLEGRVIGLTSYYDFDLNRKGYFKQFKFSISVAADGRLTRVSPK